MAPHAEIPPELGEFSEGSAVPWLVGTAMVGITAVLFGDEVFETTW
jgi:hypothetical protein